MVNGSDLKETAKVVGDINGVIKKFNKLTIPPQQDAIGLKDTAWAKLKKEIDDLCKNSTSHLAQRCKARLLQHLSMAREPRDGKRGQELRDAYRSAKNACTACPVSAASACLLACIALQRVGCSQQQSKNAKQQDQEHKASIVGDLLEADSIVQQMLELLRPPIFGGDGGEISEVEEGKEEGRKRHLLEAGGLAGPPPSQQPQAVEDEPVMVLWRKNLKEWSVDACMQIEEERARSRTKANNTTSMEANRIRWVQEVSHWACPSSDSSSQSESTRAQDVQRRAAERLDALGQWASVLHRCAQAARECALEGNLDKSVWQGGGRDKYGIGSLGCYDSHSCGFGLDSRYTDQIDAASQVLTMDDHEWLRRAVLHKAYDAHQLSHDFHMRRTRGDNKWQDSRVWLQLQPGSSMLPAKLPADQAVSEDLSFQMPSERGPLHSTASWAPEHAKLLLHPGGKGARNVRKVAVAQRQAAESLEVRYRLAREYWAHLPSPQQRQLLEAPLLGVLKGATQQLMSWGSNEGAARATAVDLVKAAMSPPPPAPPSPSGGSAEHAGGSSIAGCAPTGTSALDPVGGCAPTGTSAPGPVATDLYSCPVCPVPQRIPGSRKYMEHVGEKHSGVPLEDGGGGRSFASDAVSSGSDDDGLSHHRRACMYCENEVSGTFFTDPASKRSSFKRLDDMLSAADPRGSRHAGNGVQYGHRRICARCWATRVTKERPLLKWQRTVIPVPGMDDAAPPSMPAGGGCAAGSSPSQDESPAMVAAAAMTPDAWEEAARGCAAGKSVEARSKPGAALFKVVPGSGGPAALADALKLFATTPVEEWGGAEEEQGQEQQQQRQGSGAHAEEERQLREARVVAQGWWAGWLERQQQQQHNGAGAAPSGSDSQHQQLLLQWLFGSVSHRPTSDAWQLQLEVGLGLPPLTKTSAAAVAAKPGGRDQQDSLWQQGKDARADLLCREYEVTAATRQWRGRLRKWRRSVAEDLTAFQEADTAAARELGRMQSTLLDLELDAAVPAVDVSDSAALPPLTPPQQQVGGQQQDQEGGPVVHSSRGEGDEEQADAAWVQLKEGMDMLEATLQQGSRAAHLHIKSGGALDPDLTNRRGNAVQAVAKAMAAVLQRTAACYAALYRVYRVEDRLYNLLGRAMAKDIQQQHRHMAVLQQIHALSGPNDAQPLKDRSHLASSKAQEADEQRILFQSISQNILQETSDLSRMLSANCNPYLEMKNFLTRWQRYVLLQCYTKAAPGLPDRPVTGAMRALLSELDSHASRMADLDAGLRGRCALLAVQLLPWRAFHSAAEQAVLAGIERKARAYNEQVSKDAADAAQALEDEPKRPTQQQQQQAGSAKARKSTKQKARARSAAGPAANGQATVNGQRRRQQDGGSDAEGGDEEEQEDKAREEPPPADEERQTRSSSGTVGGDAAAERVRAPGEPQQPHGSKAGGDAPANVHVRDAENAASVPRPRSPPEQAPQRDAGAERGAVPAPPPPRKQQQQPPPPPGRPDARHGSVGNGPSEDASSQGGSWRRPVDRWRSDDDPVAAAPPWRRPGPPPMQEAPAPSQQQPRSFRAAAAEPLASAAAPRAGPGARHVVATGGRASHASGGPAPASDVSSSSSSRLTTIGVVPDRGVSSSKTTAWSALWNAPPGEEGAEGEEEGKQDQDEVAEGEHTGRQQDNASGEGGNGHGGSAGRLSRQAPPPGFDKPTQRPHHEPRTAQQQALEPAAQLGAVAAAAPAAAPLPSQGLAPAGPEAAAAAGDMFDLPPPWEGAGLALLPSDGVAASAPGVYAAMGPQPLPPGSTAAGHTQQEQQQPLMTAHLPAFPLVAAPPPPAMGGQPAGMLSLQHQPQHHHHQQQQHASYQVPGSVPLQLLQVPQQPSLPLAAASASPSYALPMAPPAHVFQQPQPQLPLRPSYAPGLGLVRQQSLQQQQAAPTMSYRPQQSPASQPPEPFAQAPAGAASVAPSSADPSAVRQEADVLPPHPGMPGGLDDEEEGDGLLDVLLGGGCGGGQLQPPHHQRGSQAEAGPHQRGAGGASPGPPRVPRRPPSEGKKRVKQLPRARRDPQPAALEEEAGQQQQEQARAQEQQQAHTQEPARQQQAAEDADLLGMLYAIDAARADGSGSQGWPAAATAVHAQPAAAATPGAVISAGGARPQQRAGAGLANAQGEYHCFLNVIIQCLWHLPSFRAMMLEDVARPQDCDTPECRVLCSLFDVFCALRRAASDAMGSAAVIAGGAEPRNWASVAGAVAHSVVDPTPLRTALSNVNRSCFQSGEMGDAHEALEGILECLDAALLAPGQWRTQSPVQSLFGQSIHERMDCQRCTVTSHSLRYSKLTQLVPASALRAAANAAHGGGGGGGEEDEAPTLEQVLRQQMQHDPRPCDEDVGGCGLRQATTMELLSAPKVFTLAVVWDTAAASEEEVGRVCQLVATQMDIREVYDGLPDRSVFPDYYRLRCMVCYYGSHYSVFVFQPSHRMWQLYDDSSVRDVGTWAAVSQQCRVGRLQPLLLMYEARFE